MPLSRYCACAISCTTIEFNTIFTRYSDSLEDAAMRVRSPTRDPLSIEMQRMINVGRMMHRTFRHSSGCPRFVFGAENEHMPLVEFYASRKWPYMVLIVVRDSNKF